ncbi:hypothetical protein BUALT_Bualt07G0138200 [Buddleja alternifolia]|uniref:Uncharacterized protein n=1 Tax=Buddleja alternifolia TaxID=168488 RepID=A0AAV6XID0_9LAMI|nr:hypothetical protein BUALT_Bualt07G0138200 [Buddleja alternifolia]
MAQQKTIQTITAITVLMLLYVGSATATCYGSCLEDCFHAGNERVSCLIKCLWKCIKVESSNKLNTCNQCARFDNDINKVDDCVKCDVSKCSRLSRGMAHAPVSTSPGKPSSGAPLET